MQALYELYKKSTGVTTDSRNINPGVIFFALKGEHFNGNEFAMKALQNGAAYAVVDEKQFAKDDRCILVDNVLKTLSDLAAIHRKILNCPVLAITGSNGKTTTKELIVQVLSEKYNLTYTKGNLNNHIGLPLTILSAGQDTEMMILEMGANHSGEIDHLCRIAQPDFGLITNTGKAHLEGFGSPEVVFQTKTELYLHIKNEGNGLFVNADDKKLMDVAKPDILMTYGTEHADVIGCIMSQIPYVCLTWEWNNRKENQPTQLFGSYNIYNVLAAVTCGIYFKIDPSAISKSISEYAPKNYRSQYVETAAGNKVILDAYNANPTSMNLALDEFFAMPGSPKYLFLGSMLELGQYSDDEHVAILRKLSANQPEYVALVGNEFLKFQTLFPDFHYYANSDILSSFLVSKNIAGAYIIIKGSRNNALEKIMDKL
jgi:UDP-N-acetylmuramoyl-tripeptide--D-alanyl-D-alanine ligase